MKKKTLWKDIKKSITHSWGRFFSIMMLMALGSFALVGLVVAGPNMRKTGEHYFKSLNTSDITIISDYGIDESEQEYIEKASQIKELEYVYLKDVTIKDTNISFRLFSKPSSVSQFELVEGRLPETKEEIAIDKEYKSTYKIGDIISFKEKEENSDDDLTLTIHDFKVVGYINSGEILSSLNRGQTTVGTGELDSFAIISEEVFNSDVYMMAKINFEDTYNMDPYSEEYNDLINTHKTELSNLLKEQQDIRFSSIKSEYQEKIDDGRKELNDAINELEDARTELNDAKIKIADAKSEIADNETKLNNAQKDISNAEKEISDNETLLNQKQSEYNDGASKLASKQAEYAEAVNTLNKKQSEYDIGLVEFTTKKAEYNSAVQEVSKKQAEYDAALQEFEPKKLEFEAAQKEINTAQTQIDTKTLELEGGKQQYENAINQLTSVIATSNESLSNPTLSEEEKLQIQQTIEQYTLQLEQTQQEYNNFLNTTYNPNVELLKIKQNELDTKKSELATAQVEINKIQVQLENAKNQLDLANSQIATAKLQLDEAEKQLADGKSQLDSGKTQLSTAKTQIDDANNQLASAKSQLEEGKSKLNNAKVELSDAKEEYTSGVQKLKDAKNELSDKELEYNDKLQEFEEKEPDALEEIAENEDKLNDAQKKLDKLNVPTYSVDNRRELPGGEGYSIYETVSKIIDSLAKVFPIFLYFVAALVTLTTMTRFVSEERINSGTLKALGYTNADIIKKFALYGFIAGMSGTILGIILGHTLLPYIVYNAYSNGFTLPKIELHFYPFITIIAVLLSLLSSVLPAFLVANKELKENPASLLLPKAPKSGSKIFLEHLKPIWNKMSFTHKVTARNIFRYKQRMFMTIFGVAGSAALLFTGFSVQASISEINERQFGEIIKYDMIVALNDDLEENEETELSNLLNSDTVSDYHSIYYEEVSKIAGKNNDRQEIKLIVTENEEAFRQYIHLINRKTEENINLSDDGVVISERLAQILNVSRGDSFTITDSSDIERTVTVSDVCEMYAGHFIFMNKTEYEKLYNSQFENNAKLVLLKDSSLENTKIEASKFIELSSVAGVSQNTTLYNQIDTIVDSLDQIMKILIVLAALLAIVILYNLTNINVSERIRELSTIKVLGFFDKEVTMYIYRETICLSAIGIIVGWILGILLHSYILNVVPPDEVMFNPTIWIGAYIIPLVTITIISYILKHYVNNKLKKVDMLEALKSVD